ncbi:SurA N-terminal domain-containing protein [Pacificimonas sp. WHA3]|uniref:SurA N-terminal domain-containing protein n=1 Tax=Pacificimonas pallii TaxID=2827236 RepID=A0ABS6SDQ0_9SPHN|nr:peptidylprolyl isomerase [Pacificimonas pallii]MBV7256528.1 SurA N-terminal domain-containing protein [Pacificimonas pallii]
MISALRRALRNPIMLALLGLVLVAFVIVGMGNPLGGPASGTVAKVGDEEISVTRLTSQFDRTLQIVRQENPQITADQVIAEGGLAATLDRLIGAVALKQFAETLGLGTSKRLVDAEIASMEAFRGPTGEFDEQSYRQVLAAQNIDENSLRIDMSDDVMRRHVLSIVADTGNVPAGLAEPIALYQLEQRSLKIGFVPFARFEDQPEPTEEDIEGWYQDNLSRFTIPERRRFSYAIIDRAALAEGIEITDDEIVAAYEAGSALYGASEARSLQQAIVPTEAQAKEFAKRVVSGETFAAVAADMLSLTADDLSLEAMSQASLAASSDQEFADAAFAADEGAVIGPLQSDFGWRVAIVDGVEPVPGRALAEVRDEIRQRLIDDRAETLLADRIGAIEDAIAEGASLKEIAAEQRFELQTPPALTQAGRTPDQPQFALPARDAPVLATVFEYADDEDPVAAEIGDGVFAVVKTEEIIASAPVKLDLIRDQVRQQLIAERQIAAATEAAEAVAEVVRGGGDMDAELRQRRMPPSQDLTLRRVELAAQNGQVPAALTLGFVQDKGDVRAVADPERGAVVVVATTDIVPGKIEDAPSFVTSLRTQLRDATARELQMAFSNAITQQAGVERFPNAMNEVEARYSGTELSGE